MDSKRKSGAPRRRGRPSKNVFVTKTGKSIKVNRSLNEKWRARKDERSRKKAAYLSTLPKNRWKRMLVRMHPKRVIRYWFSRDGAIMALKIFGICIVLGFLLLISMFAYFRKDLPNIKDISSSNLGGSIDYYDRTGTVLLFQDYNAVKRVPVQSSQISPYMKEATVAIEDKNFYHEGAFSASGILRAGLHDTLGIGGGGGLQGASTITEQLVKLNEGLTGSRTITTKLKEVILAVELERQYSKDDVLTGYLNIAPYGGVDYGVQSAAQDYFHENANQLTLAQAAMLAAIPQAPSYYSPYSSPQYNSAASENDFGEGALIGRQQYILDQMAKQGYITQAQADAAKQVDVLAQVQPLQNKYAGIQDPYFVLAAKQQLENQYGAATVDRGGWKVITTMNVTLQNEANQLVQENLPLLERNHGDEEATVEENVPTGQVDALVGGTDFNNPDYGQINYAEQPIPPGSSFKPYDYSTLINDTNNAGAGSLIYDVRQPLPGYPCTNTLQPLQGGNCLQDYDFKFPGAEELRYALAGSRNVPAVKAMLSVIPNKQCVEGVVSGCVPSINKVISTADAMMDVPNAYQCYGDAELTQPTQCYASSAIGDGAYLTIANHVNGLSTLGRLGQAIPQTFILKITDANNKVIYNWTQPQGTQVIKADTAYILDNILSDPNASYLPASQKFQAYKGWNIAVKTGTTNDEYDALMTSWTTQYAVVSWVGYHSRNVALTAGLSEVLTEPLTKNLIEYSLSALGTKPVNWTQPSDIKVLPAFRQTQHIDYGDVEPGPATDLYPSWYVAPTGGSTSNETIDKVSGGTATSCTPALAKEDATTQNASKYSVDIFWPIGSASASTTSSTNLTDTVHLCSDVPPSITVTPNTAATCDTVNGCSFTVTVQQGTHALNDPTNYPQFPGQINLLVNGTQATSVTIPASDCSGSPQVCTVPVSFTPAASDAGQTISVSGQVIDSVLYEGTTASPVSVVVAAAGA